MQLGRTLLDQQVVDRDGQHMGKVDGVVLEVRDGTPPRVAFLVISGATLLRRIHPGLARWAERRLGQGHATRIPWKRVIKIGVDVKVDVEAARSPALYWEHWVRDHIIRRIPGS
jgi:sporulation protein YlmC with PRC-barrel domain